MEPGPILQEQNCLPDPTCKRQREGHEINREGEGYKMWGN